MGKEVKTNAMRILDRQKIPYQLNTYECGEFIDGVTNCGPAWTEL